MRPKWAATVVYHAADIADRAGVERGGIGAAALSPQGRGQRLRPLRIAAGNGHLRPGRGQPAADGFTDAAITARHQRHLAIQPEKLVPAIER